jgi:HAD superfamily hydrolase (TIGR01509 family)
LAASSCPCGAYAGILEWEATTSSLPQQGTTSNKTSGMTSGPQRDPLPRPNRRGRPDVGARELVHELGAAGHSVVLASSAHAHELDHYLDLLDVRDAIDGRTSSADVETTKPELDLAHAALAKPDGGDAVMIGDSPWDCEAARRAGVDTIAVLTGGFSEQELKGAGAVLIVESVAEPSRKLPDASLA